MSVEGTQENILDASKEWKASVTSLRDLIVILTGLTITTGIGISLRSISRFFPAKNYDIYYGAIQGDSSNSYFLDWQNFFEHMNEEHICNIWRFVLLMIGVIRFHQGNLQFLDKYYYGDKIKNPGYTAIDFFAILSMSICFTGLGFSLFHPVLYTTVFMVIMLLSMAWSFIVMSIEMGDSARMAVFLRPTLAPHTRLWIQLNWFRVNSLTLFFLLFLFGLPIDHKSIYVLCVISGNTFLDLWLNLREYFPPPSDAARRVN